MEDYTKQVCRVYARKDAYIIGSSLRHEDVTRKQIAERAVHLRNWGKSWENAVAVLGLKQAVCEAEAGWDDREYILDFTARNDVPHFNN